MAPPRKKNADLPARMFARKGKRGTTYYYLAERPDGNGRDWINLGKDRAAAFAKYGRLDSGADSHVRSNIVSELIKRYQREVYPTKAAETQRKNDQEFKHIEAVFGAMPIDAIKPVHVRKYLDLRGKTAPVRANREKALLSHLFNKAREWGITEAQNPCSGITGHKETGRQVYVFDEDFRAVYAVAEPPLQDAMDLYLLIGQRVTDVIRLMRTDIKDRRLWTRQGKTKKLVGVAITGELAKVIERILARPVEPGHVASSHLIRDAKGQALTYAKLRGMFDRARKASGVNFQLRDLRSKSATDELDLAVANERLGHSTVTMTKHYRKAIKVDPLR
ncbi:site-specific integrase [Chitiniphilus purpureus]|uniref:Site-specific integrase n=1 Tax=Chitiniphilus purpureus TaxID=2981137 RepID=A0ABY6DUG0_9NEIS|nr:site-specific integrase [Chitiniphilus sp. CD1]UXY16686.1 site-specific integrase [Chitiniphilus sp. CD1]